jgi:hypothetical protein
MKTITVFHKGLANSGPDYTVFTGSVISYMATHDGNLHVLRWQTKDKCGSTVFASGQWFSVIEDQAR